MHEEQTDEVQKVPACLWLSGAPVYLPQKEQAACHVRLTGGWRGVWLLRIRKQIVIRFPGRGSASSATSQIHCLNKKWNLPKNYPNEKGELSILCLAQLTGASTGLKQFLKHVNFVTGLLTNGWKTHVYIYDMHRN